MNLKREREKRFHRTVINSTERFERKPRKFIVRLSVSGRDMNPGHNEWSAK